MIKIVKNFHFVLLAGVLILSQSVSAQNAADDELQNIQSFMKPAGRADEVN